MSFRPGHPFGPGLLVVRVGYCREQFVVLRVITVQLSGVYRILQHVVARDEDRSWIAVDAVFAVVGGDVGGVVEAFVVVADPTLPRLVPGWLDCFDVGVNIILAQ